MLICGILTAIFFTVYFLVRKASASNACKLFIGLHVHCHDHSVHYCREIFVTCTRHGESCRRCGRWRDTGQMTSLTRHSSHRRNSTKSVDVAATYKSIGGGLLRAGDSDRQLLRAPAPSSNGGAARRSAANAGSVVLTAAGRG